MNHSTEIGDFAFNRIHSRLSPSVPKIADNVMVSDTCRGSTEQSGLRTMAGLLSLVTQIISVVPR